MAADEEANTLDAQSSCKELMVNMKTLRAATSPHGSTKQQTRVCGTKWLMWHDKKATRQDVQKMDCCA